MNQELEHLEHLKEIRALMERSTRFISLSGLSGIVAGCIALIGVGIQYWYILRLFSYTEVKELYSFRANDFVLYTAVNFLSVLILAVGSAYYFTQKKARRNNQSLWDSSSRRMLINLAIPLACGGLFCLVLYYYGLVGLIAPATLIFYGLALVSGSTFTLRDIRYLGLLQILLGFIAAFNIGWGLLFWALGFGILHVLYGLVMYYKYDRPNHV
jgi:hypothetical protein